MSPNNRKRNADKPKPRKNTKVTGERSEAAFLHKAANLGFGIAKPWGDSRRYDFIVDNGSCLHRIQVKCTESIRARAYETGGEIHTRCLEDILPQSSSPVGVRQNDADDRRRIGKEARMVLRTSGDAAN